MDDQKKAEFIEENMQATSVAVGVIGGSVSILNNADVPHPAILHALSVITGGIIGIMVLKEEDIETVFNLSKTIAMEEAKKAFAFAQAEEEKPKA